MLVRTRMQTSFDVRPVRVAVLFGLIVGLALATRLRAAETITATAQMKTAAGATATAPLTLTLDRLSTDREREQVVAALKGGGTARIHALIDKWAAIGSVRVGSTLTPVRYAFAQPIAGGRLITVVTSAPIAFVGGGLPNAPPRAGFDLGMVLLDVPASGTGHGELAPATKIGLNKDGAVVTDDYGTATIVLSNVTVKKQ
jgi:hypothetical protein